MEENLYEKCLEAFELVYKNSSLKEKKKRKRNMKNKLNTKYFLVSSYCNQCDINRTQTSREWENKHIFTHIKGLPK